MITRLASGNPFGPNCKSNCNSHLTFTHLAGAEFSTDRSIAESSQVPFPTNQQLIIAKSEASYISQNAASALAGRASHAIVQELHALALVGSQRSRRMRQEQQ